MAKGFLVLSIVYVLMHGKLVAAAAAAADCQKILPEIDRSACCSRPELFSEENEEKCKNLLIDSSPTFVPMNNENPSTVAVQRDGIYQSDPLKYMTFVECAINDTGILENGQLNESALSKHLMNVLKDAPDLISTLETSFKTCLPKVEKHYSKMQEKIKNKTTADPNTASKMIVEYHMNGTLYRSPVVSHLIKCVSIETFINCPETIWSKSKECNEMRYYAIKCVQNHGDSMEDSA